MKHIVKDFLMRGMVAAGFGPLALVVFYLITAHHAGLETISVSQVCTGILSLTALAFIAGYLAIWAVIYCFTKRRTERLNEILKQNQAQ